jgi:hypothetical protein
MHRNIWTAVPRQEHTTASASNGGAPITRSRVVTGHSSFSAYRHDCARFGWIVEHRCQAVLPGPPLNFRIPVIPVSTTLSAGGREAQNEARILSGFMSYGSFRIHVGRSGEMSDIA